MQCVLQDLRFAIRTLRRRPSFAAVAIITIALGIGAASSIYSVVEGVVLRPLPFRDPGKLVAIWKTYPDWRKEPILVSMWDRIPLSGPEYRDMKEKSTSFSDVGIWGGSPMTLTGRDGAERVAVTHASASLLQVLATSPFLGRNFLPDEDVLQGPRVAMVSYEAWRKRFGGAADLIGREVILDDAPRTVVGVLPPGLRLGRGENISDFWVPIFQDSNTIERGNHSYEAVGRIKPGITLERASAESQLLLKDSDDPRQMQGVRLGEWRSDQTRDVRAPLLMLLAAAGLLLLVACVNVATLMLGEASTREHEMSARMALGAGRGRLVRQLLTESMALAGVAAAVGIVIAWGGTKALVAVAPPRIPGLEGVHLNLKVLLFAVATAMLTGLLFGIAPALVVSRSSPASMMRGSTGQSVRGRGSLQRTLVAAELALSVMLLIAAGLLSRSFEKLTSVNPGFRSDHLLVVSPAMPRPRWADSVGMQSYYARAMERVAALPGVVAVSGTDLAPFAGGSSSSSFEIEGRPEAPGAPHHEAQQRVVTPGFFAKMNIPVLMGRALSEEDRGGTPKVLVISESMARRDWPTEPAIGKRIKWHGASSTIVGIVGDVKYRKLSTEDQATVYAPISQHQRTPFLALMVRTADDPLALASAVRNALREVDPTVPVTRVESMTTLMRQSFDEERYRTTLISIFGVMAALLAAVGMYGVTSRAVSRRTREVGIRMALGASAPSVVRLILTYTLAGVTLGVVGGLVASLAAARLLTPYLFGLRPTDPVTYIGITAFLAVVSVIATWLPARRAARVEPAIVLRE
jgi:putative ABC transport system permease protein